MAFIALRPCNFGGQHFLINDTIPDELIHPEGRQNLVKMGVIAAVGESAIVSAEKDNAAPQDDKITLRVEGIDRLLALTHEGFQAAFDVLVADVKEAEAIVNEMTDNDALIFLNMADKRKGIKAATEERGKALASVEETAAEK